MPITKELKDQLSELIDIYLANFGDDTNDPFNDFYAWYYESDKSFLLNSPTY